jgi:hypothetical protein
MKPSAAVLSLVFAIVAAVAIVWVGRYSPLERAGMLPGATAEVGPPISKTGPYPKAAIDQTEHNFGKMGVRSKGEHTFTIRNEGESDLVLMARPEDRSCQCTAAELSRETPIPPGESIDVLVKWEVKALTSEFRHSATLRTNDPQNKTIRLEITGQVEELIVVQPSGQWELGELNPKEPTVFTATMHSPMLDEFAIEKFECANPLVTAEWQPLSDEKKGELNAKSGYEVHVKVAPGSPIGIFSERVVFHTSEELLKEMTYTLRGSCPGPIEFFGPGYRADANALLMGEFPASEGKEVTLSVIVRNLEDELQMTEAKQETNTLKLEFGRDERFTGKNSRYLLKIIVPPGDPQDRQRKNSEKVDLFFNHPDAPQVKLRVDFLAS